MAKISWVQGDTAPDQDFIITKNGKVFDLTGYTVKFRFGPNDTLVEINSGHDTCNITSATTGALTYAVMVGDTATVGFYTGQLEVTNISTGKIQTTKNVELEITQQVN